MRFSKARSWQVARDLSFWLGERQGIYIVVDHWQFNSIEELYSILFRPNPSLSKSLFSPPISVFFFLFLVQIRRFFHQQYLWSFGFLSTFPHRVLEVFYQLNPYPVFFFSLSIIGLRDFSPAIWFSETHQLPYGARMFSVVSWFSSSVFFIGLRDFLLSFIQVSLQWFHAHQSSCLKREANVITWLLE